MEEENKNSEVQECPDRKCSDLTVVIPTLNEASNIGELIKKLRKLYPGINVVVSDDASTDGTQKVVDDLAKQKSETGGGVFLLERKDATFRGITASVLDALSYVGTPLFAVMDADLQHPPEVLGRMVEKLQDGVDMVVAARLPYKENQGLHRIFVTRIATLVAKLYLMRKGLRIIDPMSGFFLSRTAQIVPLVEAHQNRFELEGYKILFDLMRVVKRGFSIRQVSYQFQLREEGTSKLRPAHAFFFLRSLFK